MTQTESYNSNLLTFLVRRALQQQLWNRHNTEDRDVRGLSYAVLSVDGVRYNYDRDYAHYPLSCGLAWERANKPRPLIESSNLG